MEPVSTAKRISESSEDRLTRQRTESGYARSLKAVHDAVTTSGAASLHASRGGRRGAKIEHRQGGRQRVLALVRVHDSDKRCSAGLLYNLGADGMFVISEHQPALNQCVDIELALSPAWDMAIRIRALVVHHQRSGFGVMFREPDDPALTLLEASLR